MKIFTLALAAALVLCGLEWYRGRQSEKLVFAARVAQGLALAAGVENHVAYYYADQDRFPSSNAELDLPEPGHFAAQALTALNVSEGGVITITFDALSGVDHGSIRLVPVVIAPAAGLNWRCVTPSFPDISAWAPQCLYEP